MKMLFSSSDQTIVERFSNRLKQAGIICEVRRDPVPSSTEAPTSYPELWITKESDFRAATLLLIHRGLAT
jgi:hypothetical protein